MFNDLLFVRLKSAENALREGRWDEAYRLASASDLRDHRRAAAVLSALTERFLERARTHFRADRFTEALMDIDRADAGGVMKEQIAEMRGQVRVVAAEVYRKEEARRERIAGARRRMEEGSLTAGRKMLEEASGHDPAARQLLHEMDHRSQEAQRLAAEADQLMGEGHWTAAVERVRRARSLQAHDDAVMQTEASLCRAVLERVYAALVAGELRRAGDELACLGNLGDGIASKREVTHLLAVARQASLASQTNNHAEARRHLMSLGRVFSPAPWVEKTIDQLRQLEDLRTTLCSGPLGELLDVEPKLNPPARSDNAFTETLALGDRLIPGNALADRLLLIVDGGGSYLLLRGASASIGRAACEHPADIAIFSDLSERHAHVTRVEDDYFLVSAKQVEVGGRATQHHLLRDADRMVLGRKAKLTFRLPNRQSASAILELSDTTKMPHDVRRVILFHQHATMGAGGGSHILCRQAAMPLVLFERNGGLWVRMKNDGHADVESRPLKMGMTMNIGGVSFVLNPWIARASGTS